MRPLYEQTNQSAPVEYDVAQPAMHDAPAKMHEEMSKRREMALDAARFHRDQLEQAETIAAGCEGALGAIDARQIAEQSEAPERPTVYR